MCRNIGCADEGSASFKRRLNKSHGRMAFIMRFLRSTSYGAYRDCLRVHQILVFVQSLIKTIRGGCPPDGPRRLPAHG